MGSTPADARPGTDTYSVAERKRFHFLYRTTNLVNGKYYIGVHSTWNLDDGYLGSGNILRRSVSKYGKESFVCEVLQFFNTRESAFSAEIKEVSEHLGKPLCMNLVEGGLGGSWKAATARWNWLLKNDPVWTAWMRSRWSAAMRRRWLDFPELMAETRSERFTFEGRSHSEESKRKMGLANSLKQAGSLNSQYGTVWMVKEGVSAKVNLVDVDDRKRDGWIRGRIVR